MSDQGFLDTNGTFTTMDVPGASSTDAFGVYSAGAIVGAYSENGSTYGFLATPESAPLPAAGGTIPGGVVLLGWVGRHLVRRRKA